MTPEIQAEIEALRRISKKHAWTYPRETTTRSQVIFYSYISTTDKHGVLLVQTLGQGAPVFASKKYAVESFLKSNEQSKNTSLIAIYTGRLSPGWEIRIERGSASLYKDPMVLLPYVVLGFVDRFSYLDVEILYNEGYFD